MNEKIERNKTIIEWSSNIFGIFWGVWWGMYIDNVMISEIESNNFPITLNKVIIMGVLALSIVIFTHSYVEWMWKIRILSRSTTNETTRKYLKFPIIALIVISILLTSLSIRFKIETSLLIYGLLLTGFWMTLNIFLVKKD
ncbi:MAG: hypothetical protein GYA51_00990 [Candidatus Methanofastidiosa archaeon]|nr:hypothetical protein [Candidatus Methanofastidiosa archaeon]